MIPRCRCSARAECFARGRLLGEIRQAGSCGYDKADSALAIAAIPNHNIYVHSGSFEHMVNGRG